MPCFSVPTAYLFIILLNEAITATPQVAFPVNSQLPPVAYASQPYQFTFSSDTFSSALSDVSYTISNQPAWLSIDALTRTLSGTPTSKDIGAPGFTLIASDSTGQTTSSITLVVLEKRGLYVANEDILPQLADAGAVSVPNTLVLQPQQSFAFTLQSTVFGGSAPSAAFYAISANRSPLPSWLHFDSTNIRFSGIAPPLLGQNPLQQSYTFSFVASSVVGFSEASVSFTVSIAEQILQFTSYSYVFNASTGSLLQIPSLLATLRVNGALVQRSEIVSVSTNPPTWLHFNGSDFSFTGTPPQDFDSSTFYLTVGGTSTNKANTTIIVRAHAEQDASSTNLGSTLAAPGSHLMYVISPPPQLGANVRITVNSTDLPTWLSFISSNNTLLGYIPYDASPGVRTIRFTISNGLRVSGGFITLTITPSGTSSTKSGSPVSGTSIATSPATSQPSTQNRSMPGKRLMTILLAVLLPVAVLVCSLGILLAYRRWKVNSKEGESKMQTEHRKPSRPAEQPELSQGDGALITSSSVLPYSGMSQNQASSPHVELSWAPDSVKKTRDRPLKRSRTSHSSLVGSSWDDLIDYRARSKESLRLMPFKLFQRQRSSTTPATETETIRVVPKRPSRPDSLVLTGQPEETEGLSSMQTYSVGLPKRLSAAGHGAGGDRSFAHTNNRSSWQTTMGSIPAMDRRRSTLIMSSFPQPPSNGSLNELVRMSQDMKEVTAQGQDVQGRVEGSSSGWQSRSQAKGRHSIRRASNQPGILQLPFSAIGSTLLQRPIEEERQMSSHGLETNKPPPVPQRSQARASASYILNSMHARAYSAEQHPLHRETSMASSHQFDSAVSSDSQWEDESFVLANKDAEQTNRTTNVPMSNNQPPPQVPPRSVIRGNSLSDRARASSDAHQARLTNYTSLYRSRSNVQPSEQSDQDSFRFI